MTLYIIIIHALDFQHLGCCTHAYLFGNQGYPWRTDRWQTIYSLFELCKCDKFQFTIKTIYVCKVWISLPCQVIERKYIISYPCQFQACNKSQYCLGPSVTGPHRKRCLNIYHGLHCIRTDQWKGISILTMVNIEIRTSRTMQGRINKEMKFNISHGWYWNKST